MPFKKVGPNRYKSPSGRVLTEAMVQAYYARKGGNMAKKRKRKKGGGRKKY